MIWLAALDVNRSLRRALLFAAASGAMLAAAIGACYAIWGKPFVCSWTFEVLGKRGLPRCAASNML